MKILKAFLIIFLMLSVQAFAQKANPNLTISSSAFKDGGNIPDKYTCTGENVNPSLDIQNVPIGTESFVLVVHDPDAPAADFMHWVVYSIHPSVKHIAENSIPGKELINNFNQFPYGGPCPPNGHTHHYMFDLYALDAQFAMNENGSPQGLLQRMNNHILGKARLVGLYKKS